MTEIHNIEIEGFGSIIDRMEYKFHTVGLHTILGKNGAGKTSILNALYWCMYGKLLKGENIEPWPHLITKQYKGTKVTLNFTYEDKNYGLTRCLNYNGKLPDKKSGRSRVLLLQDGTPIAAKGKKNIQPEIVRLLGYSSELFKNSVLFGQRLKRLIQESGPDKKKIFEEAFESAFIGKARDMVAKRLTHLIADHLRYKTQMEIEKTYINGAREKITLVKKLRADFQDEKDKALKELAREIAETEKLIKNPKGQGDFKNPQKSLRILAAKEAKLEKKISTKWESQEFDLTLRINRQETEVDKLNTKLGKNKEAIKNYPDKCSECGQDMPRSRKKTFERKMRENQKTILTEMGYEMKQLEELRADHKIALAKADKQKGLKAKLGRVKAKIKELGKIELEWKLAEERQRAQIASLMKIKERYEEIKNKPLPASDIKTWKKELITHKGNYHELRTTAKSLQKKIDIDKWLMGDPLGNAGLKAFIFDSMMGKVNKYLKTYRDIVGFDIKVGVDLESTNKDILITIHKGGDDVPYADLSGGQEQLVDVVMAFSLNDVVYEAKPINILLLDELFESLDKDNIEKVEDIIQAKALTRSVHLISHRSEFKPRNCNITRVQLVNGKTVIQD